MATGIQLKSDGANVYPVCAFPVGYIYPSTEAESPASIFGGTWEQLEDVFLLCSGDTYAAGTTGGEASHTLTIAEMPAHSHSITGGYSKSSGSRRTSGAGYQNNSITLSTSSVGSGTAHDNMPPYLVVYLWKRVA